MNSDKKSLFVPLLLVVLGTGWLLTALDFMPRVDWAWTLAVAAIGLLAMLIGGVDKVTVVVGPFFILASCLSLLRQTGRMSLNIEVPILVIAAGLLMLFARLPWIPAPSWLVESRREATSDVKRK